MHSSTSSQMPSLSWSAAHVPPHTPRASIWFPSQSQFASGMSSTPAFVDVAWPVADATGVQFVNALVDVVTNAIVALVGPACASVHTPRDVKLVSVKSSLSSGNVSTPAFVVVAWPVADASRHRVLPRTRRCRHKCHRCLGRPRMCLRTHRERQVGLASQSQLPSVMVRTSAGLERPRLARCKCRRHRVLPRTRRRRHKCHRCLGRAPQSLRTHRERQVGGGAVAVCIGNVSATRIRRCRLACCPCRSKASGEHTRIRCRHKCHRCLGRAPHVASAHPLRASSWFPSQAFRSVRFAHPH